ncbi:CDP-alcohol phosphatidyltransferase family protein [Demequina sp.]|uniref:CDP-alcohol phosphatidyltransferase family protein n=1 Tax=Demequina sp. TaxID=2050685 RepID=UPI0025D531B5|nr:CDP-alcohol phosphatidyltransferase family protein [Demequina sp.]
MEAAEPHGAEPEIEPSDAVWTVPNLISAIRIALIVVFTVLLVGHHDGWAIAALAAAGVSDFLDGYLARRWGQVTRLGRVLDPAADRLLTLAVVLGLAMRGIIPWWLVAFLFARDLVVGAALLLAHRRGISSSQVTFAGKAATAALYVFLPAAYLAAVVFPDVPALLTVAIAGAAGAGVVYWYAGIGYVRDLRARASTTRGRAAVPPEGSAGLG